MRIVEPPVRLSQSSIWGLEREYYVRRGIQAWASGDVPHSGTNNPPQARADAQVFEGLLADAAGGAFGPFEPDEPAYVIELGAGSGAFAFHFLRALEPDVLAARPHYVLTDLAGSNFEYWKTHPKLAPLVAEGSLEMAQLDATAAASVRLEPSGTVLAAGQQANPILFVANYFFDVLPQDLYVVEDGVLYEEAVALALPDGLVDLDDEELFAKLFMPTLRRPVRPHHYGDAALDAALAEVAAQRPDGPFLFPSTALLVLEGLHRLTGGRLAVVFLERPETLQEIRALLVAQAGGDLADAEESEQALRAAHGATVVGVSDDCGPASGAAELVGATAFRAYAVCGLISHGRSFSLPVETEAFAALAHRWGGELLEPRARPRKTATTVLVAGAAAAPHLRRRYALAFDEGSPEERYVAVSTALLWLLQRGEPAGDTAEDAGGPEGHQGDDELLPLLELLSFVRLCSYDNEVFGTLYPLFARAIVGADDETVAETIDALHTICARHYPMGSKSDPALASAALLAPIGRYDEALEFLARSVELRGPQPQVSYNAALCHLRLGHLTEALAAADDALAFDDPLPAASGLRAAILEEIEARRAASG